jgi:hypothetical protein
MMCSVQETLNEQRILERAGHLVERVRPSVPVIVSVADVAPTQNGDSGDSPCGGLRALSASQARRDRLCHGPSARIGSVANDPPNDDTPWYAPGHRRVGISRQRQPGEEVWRLRDSVTGRVQSCELRDDSSAGGG